MVGEEGGEGPSPRGAKGEGMVVGPEGFFATWEVGSQGEELHCVLLIISGFAGHDCTTAASPAQQLR